MSSVDLNNNELSTLIRLLDANIRKRTRAEQNRLARGVRTEGWDPERSSRRWKVLREKLAAAQDPKEAA